MGSIVVRGTIDGPLNHVQLALAAEGAHVGVGPCVATNLQAELKLTGKRVDLQRVVFGLAGGTVQGTGTLDLASEHLDVQLEGTLALSPIVPLQQAVRAQPLFPPPLTLDSRFHSDLHTLTLEQVEWAFDGLSGKLSGTLGLDGIIQVAVDVDGPLPTLPAMTGRLVLDRLCMRSNGVELQNTSPLRWPLAGGVLQFEAACLQAQGAHLDMRGSINLGQEQLTITIVGWSPLALLSTRILGIRFQQGAEERLPDTRHATPHL